MTLCPFFIHLPTHTHLKTSFVYTSYMYRTHRYILRPILFNPPPPFSIHTYMMVQICWKKRSWSLSKEFLLTFFFTRFSNVLFLLFLFLMVRHFDFFFFFIKHNKDGICSCHSLNYFLYFLRVCLFEE